MMEAPESEMKRSTKRRRKKHPTSPAPDANTLFAVLLSALHHSSSSLVTIKRCLVQLRLSLTSQSPTPNPNPNPITVPILSLLPVLIKSKWAEIATRSIEIVGAASLVSFAMNERIALDGEIVKCLISALASPERSVSIAACNAILDLCTTTIGRQRLLEFSVIENIIVCFIQVPKSSAALVSLFAEDDGSKTCFRIGFKEDELVVLLLNGAVTLINTCTIEQLEKVPWRFRKSLLLFLKKLWQDVHKQMLLGTILQLNQGRQFCVSNIGTNNLAESIFRLSINAGQPTVRYNIEKVRRSFFCPGEVSFEHFLLNHWEMSPLLIRSPLKAISTQDDIFTSFVQLFRSKEAVPSVLSLMLQNFTSALPISSDELDVLNFLKEVRDLLGCPMIYQQDIRVMKTQKREMHFFQKPLDSCFFEAPHFLYVDDILRCEEAYKEGYTMALRGIEFRLESVAAIADGLASLFGQPSAGANLYLTPPNSQGLACHFDDHCVLVCQLFGAKQWTIFPPSNLRLPRLYETSDSMHDLEGGSMIVDGCKQFWLKEGDVLYIPRGFPHEACTSFDNDGSSGNAGFSLHLTLAIEVEPPFEWEGFIHVALHHWDQKNLRHDTATSSLSWSLDVAAVNLIHVAVKVLGCNDPTFRKACMVGAISLPLVTEGWLNINQRTIFKQLLTKISTESSFLDTVKSVEAAIQKREDPFQDLKWLQHLNKKGKASERHIRVENLFDLVNQQKDKAEVAFMDAKSRFCKEVEFEDVQQNYMVLLEKYRTARNQYKNGMLSLHCN